MSYREKDSFGAFILALIIGFGLMPFAWVIENAFGSLIMWGFCLLVIVPLVIGSFVIHDCFTKRKH